MNEDDTGVSALPVPKLVAASKKTFSYKINHLFQGNPIRTVFGAWEKEISI